MTDALVRKLFGAEGGLGNMGKALNSKEAVEKTAYRK